MKKNILLKKRTVLSKPVFLKAFLSYVILMLLLFSILGMVISEPIYDFIHQGDYQVGKVVDTYRDTLVTYVKDNSDEALEKVRVQTHNLGLYEVPTEVYINDEKIIDTWNCLTVMVIKKETHDIYTGFHKIDEYNNPNLEEALEYSKKYSMSLNMGYYLLVKDCYINEETKDVIPGVTEVYKVGFEHEKLYKELDLTPVDKSVLEGYTYYDDKDLSIRMLSLTIPKEESKGVSTTEFSFGENNENLCSIVYDTTHMQFEVNANRTLVIAVSLGAVIFISLVLGVIRYTKDKAVYDVFEHRRKTTEAMAHDLKTPLAVAALYVDNLRVSEESEREEYTNKIEDSLKHMNGLISDILEFSKSQYVLPSIEKETMDVKEEIDKLLEEISPVILKKNLKIQSKGTKILTADLSLWNQAIKNLLDNAVKYSPKNSTIGILIEEKKLTISNDTDIKIENPQKLLEPFVKGDKSRGDKGGSGLGLSVAKNNLENMGFDLGVSIKEKKFTATVKY